MLGVARELTVVLHALWQNKALGPRLSASYTFVHMYTVPFRLYLLYDVLKSRARDAASVLRAPDRLHLHARCFTDAPGTRQH